MDTNEILNLTNEPINNVKKKKPVLLIILFLIVIIILVIGVICYNNKQNTLNGKIFMDLLTDEQYILEMFKKNEDVSNDGELNYSFSFYNESGESTSINANIIVQNENLDGKIFENEKIVLEFIKQGDTIAFYAPDTYEKFIAVSSENIVELGKKFGYDFSAFADKEELNDAFGLLKRIATRYGGVIENSIGKHIKVQKNQEVIIAGNTCNVDVYKLDLDLKAFSDVYKEILGVLRYDRDGLALVAALIANQDGRKIDEVYSEIVQDIENQYLGLTFAGFMDESENEDLFEIVLYDENGKNIKTQLIVKDDMDSEISLESKKFENKDYIKYIVIADGEKSEIIYEMEDLGEKYSGEIKFVSEDNSSSDIEIVHEKIKNPTSNIRKINEQNYILLNRASDEELNEVCEKIFGMSLEEFRKSNLDEDELLEDNETEKDIEDLEKEVYIKSESYSVYFLLEVGMTKEEVISLLQERDVEVMERIDGSIAVTKYGKTIVSVYFDENQKVQLIYNEIYNTTKF